MNDIILESLRCIVVSGILIVMFHWRRTSSVCNIKGARFIFTGVLLVSLGTLFDLSDNFTQLNRFLIIGDTPGQAFMEKIVGYTLGHIFITIGILSWLPRMLETQKITQDELKKASEELRVLKGFLSICANCKMIRNDDGEWIPIEAYISAHSDVLFSHGICPDCAKELYSDQYERIQKNKAGD